MFRALWSLCSAVVTFGSAHAASPPVVAGPFEIQLVPTRIGAGGFPNTTMNPFRTTTISQFRIKHRGKPVTVVDSQHTIAEFADVRILDGASRPALLLSYAGIYLVYEDQGQPKVEILASAANDATSWQWLDAKDGQPGPEKGPKVRDATGEPLTERGGRLLLVNRKRVLDIEALRHYPIAIREEAAGGYNAGNDVVHMLSPGRSQFVLIGSRNVNNAFEYALVVADYTTGRVYGLPFERNALRFQSVADATPAWISHYFEWTREPGGAERLKPRAGVKPLPWLGRFARFSGAMVDYRLVPTQPAMYDAFLSFLRTEYGARDATPSGSPDGPQSKTLAVDGQVLRVWYRADERAPSLYAEQGLGPPPNNAYALIEKIGARFNETLARGQHQNLFEGFPPGK
jgi:hypothetical protein